MKHGIINETATGDDQKPDRRRASTLLAILADRIADICTASGLDGLAEGVYLMEELARTDPKLLKAMRPKLLGIIAADDGVKDGAEAIFHHEVEIKRAELERLIATVQ
ncbi:hypothetical protein [Bradyrhizobium sp. MOS002]|uniref:hypothetical protein n=1 Tax=Bradyrhizobium sp. MOS002 TaxID=2133947 RepID=UPI000D120D57|nr:hypothetical protein [Bradyrhizobium sp. MOS002]PSO30221.1 hypothetical protein C7G41_19465 [Bradyrhizobium sp. MOS002]